MAENGVGKYAGWDPRLIPTVRVSYTFKIAPLHLEIMQSHPVFVANKVQFVYQAILEKLHADMPSLLEEDVPKPRDTSMDSHFTVLTVLDDKT